LDTCVQVTAPARLHLGFLDLNGSTGRLYGSIGLAIDSHHTVVTARFCDAGEAHLVPEHLRQKVEGLITTFCQHFSDLVKQHDASIQLSILESIPEHAGLGSGTQLALAVGTALSRLYHIDTTTADIAALLSRGARSGIGIATFDQGGFIVDGGLASNSVVPPLLVRQPFPKQWRVVMLMEHASQGIHGQAEKKAFDALPPFPISESHAICHHTLMRLLPALIEQDIDLFGHSITEIQRLIGDHFSQVQGGRYTSSHIAQLLTQANALGHTGIAQSSWGPTGCIFVDSDVSALTLAEQLEKTISQQFENKDDYSIIIAKANLTGAEIKLHQ
jgi:beta-RFAP synthase